MDPELPKTLTFAADAAKKAHDLIAVLEEEFAKLKEALRSASELMGHAHAAVIAQPPVAPEFTMPTHPHAVVEPEPPIHHS
jgi:hypothetical protein